MGAVAEPLSVLREAGLVTRGTPASWAVFSSDERYRYLLGRQWPAREAPPPSSAYGLFADPPRLMVFVMLNPSTADALDDDVTIRRCIGFAKREGRSGIVVVNLFALRATNPKELLRASDPVGEHNLLVMRHGWQTISRDAIVVAAWGILSNRLRRLSTETRKMASTAPLWCLGFTAEGWPRHPSRLSNEAGLVKMDGSPWR